jgi:anti-sigma factor RsiW
MTEEPVMDHLEAISLFEESRLSPQRQAALQAHLSACPDCRALSAAWTADAPTPDLWPGLRARLAPPSAWPGWLTPAMAALALSLTLSAFWRPEQAWLRADQAWAYGDIVTEGKR